MTKIPPKKQTKNNKNKREKNRFIKREQIFRMRTRKTSTIYKKKNQYMKKGTNIKNDDCGGEESEILTMVSGQSDCPATFHLIYTMENSSVILENGLFQHKSKMLKNRSWHIFFLSLLNIILLIVSLNIYISITPQPHQHILGLTKMAVILGSNSFRR